MAVDKERLVQWLGNGWILRTEQVSLAKWNAPEWRAEYLCQKAQLSLHHVHDAPNGASVLVTFAAESLG